MRGILLVLFCCLIGLESVKAQNVATFGTDAVQLSPNPTDGIFRINAPYPINRVTVLSISGRQLIDLRFTDEQLRRIIDISHLARGTYFIRMEGEELGVLTKKMLKSS